MSTVDSEPVPFSTACDVRSLGDGTFTADLRQEWAIGKHPHGGFLLALLAKAAIRTLFEAGEPPAEPLVVNAEFLHAPALGPVLVRTDVRKIGRRTTVVAVVLEQRGRSCVEARVTAGRLPLRPPVWSDAPALPAEPPASALPLSGRTAEGLFHLAKGCDVRVDAATAGYLTGRRDDPPRLRLWVRPRRGEPDPYFALLAGDINPPVVFNLGRTGWAPTAALTALVRTRPHTGWLRVAVECRAVQEGWFDSDAVVVDSQGRIVCQARQLALSPLP
ncbi:aromatic compound degradation protein PaaI [Saccharomonospora piscinae]|uniref:Aromatic compound degradation protein PaaI n=1 Tax=Saccharomonospora piscinae TaxID=687388 RepID=A0A1V9A1P0_SACPI|nr:thioesterase family protein [Saccharomonospora piscinae]OQO90948.1 aromatic compound degradation protein PaaI [Saccharomonospora piscinae]TLW93642.1 thioesterase family protein [Saccharomonospora piscinae]